MKKLYIQPNTQTLPVVPMGSICVGSVHGKTSLRYGGGSDGSGEAAPM